MISMTDLCIFQLFQFFISTLSFLIVNNGINIRSYDIVINEFNIAKEAKYITQISGISVNISPSL